MTTNPSNDKPARLECDHDDRRKCDLQNGDKDYKHACTVCGAKPTVHPTDLCGPCCFGEAETIGGHW